MVGCPVAAAEEQVFEVVSATWDADTPPVDAGLALSIVGTAEAYNVDSGGCTGNERTDESLHCKTHTSEVPVIGILC